MVSSNSLKRARNFEELRSAFERAGTEEGRQAGLDFQPRPSDLIVSPFAKSGTTWLQQITHGLRTRGSMDFTEITDVTPWIEVAHDVGWNLEAEQVAYPRIFKSHMNYHDVPKGARYIYSIRHPHKVAVSYYRFLEGWWFEKDSISLEDFTRNNFMNEYETRGYWHHISSWWEQHQNPDVLILCYEDMMADLPPAVRQIAEFMNIELDDELSDIVVRQSSKEFMLAHNSQFDDHLMKNYFERRGATPSDPNTSKVTRGISDHERYRLSPALKDELDAIWDEMIVQRFGFKDYADLQKAIADLHS